MIGQMLECECTARKCLHTACIIQCYIQQQCSTQ